MGKIIDRVRNRSWCAENAREIAEIDERAAARKAASEKLAAAIMDDKRDAFDRVIGDIAADPKRELFTYDDALELFRLCSGAPLRRIQS